MVVIAAGEFDMGSSDEERAREGVPENFGNRERPVHHVKIGKAFALGRTEVTKAQYAEFSKATHRPADNNCIGYARFPTLPRVFFQTPPRPRKAGRERYCSKRATAGLLLLSASALWFSIAVGLPSSTSISCLLSGISSKRSL